MGVPEELSELAAQLLAALYDSFVGGSWRLRYTDLADAKGVDQRLMRWAVDELESAYLSEPAAGGPVIRITASGALHAERKGLVAPELVAAENDRRFQILDILQAARDERGRNSRTHASTITELTRMTDWEIYRNSQVLKGSYLLDYPTSRGLVITDAGTEQVKNWRDQKRRVERFSELQALEQVTPQQRGHELEDLLAEIARAEGWDATTRVRSQGQEHDVIIHMGLHYCLVS